MDRNFSYKLLNDETNPLNRVDTSNAFTLHKRYAGLINIELISMPCCIQYINSTRLTQSMVNIKALQRIKLHVNLVSFHSAQLFLPLTGDLCLCAEKTNVQYSPKKTETQTPTRSVDDLTPSPP